MTGEYGETQARFRLWAQDGKEEWVINHKGDWGGGGGPIMPQQATECTTVTATASAPFSSTFSIEKQTTH